MDLAGWFLIALVVAAVAAFVYYLRIPVDRQNVPRDVVSMRGKAKSLVMLHSKSPGTFADLLRDDAADVRGSQSTGPSGRVTWLKVQGALAILVVVVVLVAVVLHLLLVGPGRF